MPKLPLSLRSRGALLLFASFTAAATAFEGDAQACGGCFVSQSESTQVTGHKMILSVSMDQTTLYDQISYSGNPAEFAWVLPIRGQVDVGISSDALFQYLEQSTAVQISSPVINCGQPQFCGDSAGFNGSGGGAAGGEDPGVTVIAQEVVGPYETVQLEATDPAALSNWLTSHGYNLPAEIQPVVDAYVNEGFGFLALRLVPGQGVSAMKPVRVTSPGAGPGLPLRMVAAGTGAITPITLFVLSEGRYAPSNFPSFTIDSSALVWDWDKSKSNYSDLRAAGIAAGEGDNWLIEAAEPIYGSDYFWAVTDAAQYDPANSGYGDETTSAYDAAVADIGVLTAGIDPGSMWISRMSAELPRASLSTDLVLGASADQSSLPRYIEVQNAIGTPPECPPPPPPCDDGFYGSGGASAGGGGGVLSCAAAPGEASSGLALVVGALGLSLARRRRARS